MEGTNQLERILTEPGVQFYTVGCSKDGSTVWPVEPIEMPGNAPDPIGYMQRIARNRHELYQRTHPALELWVTASGQTPLKVSSFSM